MTASARWRAVFLGRAPVGLAGRQLEGDGREGAERVGARGPLRDAVRNLDGDGREERVEGVGEPATPVGAEGGAGGVVGEPDAGSGRVERGVDGEPAHCRRTDIPSARPSKARE